LSICSCIHLPDPNASIANLLGGGVGQSNSAVTSVSIGPPGEGESQASEDDSAPKAFVAISYAHHDDYLKSVTVIKYESAERVSVHRQHTPGPQATTVRFEGGAPVWQLNAPINVFNSLTRVGLKEQFAIGEVQYGAIPERFIQILPEEGPAEPLEIGRYYVFEVQREIGSTNYQVVRVLADKSLQTYEAEPEAGESYALCCDVDPNFTKPVTAKTGNP